MNSITMLPPGIELLCPDALEFEYRYQSGSKLDTSIFSYDKKDGSFQVETTDIAKAGLYQVRLVVEFGCYPTTSAPFEFTVELYNSCLDGTFSFLTPILDFDNSVPIVYEIYVGQIELILRLSDIYQSEPAIYCP